MAKKRLAVSASALACAMALFGAEVAAAQQVPSAPPADPVTPVDETADAQPGDGGVQDIVVTAQRRAENINDVGVTIQAFSGDTLRSVGVTDASGLAQVTPAFSFARSSANTPIYTIRGIGF